MGGLFGAGKKDFGMVEKEDLNCGHGKYNLLEKQIRRLLLLWKKSPKYR